jgi:hypothetical protein
VGKKGKGKVNLSLCFNWAPRHEGVLGKWRYNSTHSLTSALDGGEWSASRPSRFTPKERARSTHCIGGWVDLRTVLDAVVGKPLGNTPLLGTLMGWTDGKCDIRAWTGGNRLWIVPSGGLWYYRCWNFHSEISSISQFTVLNFLNWPLTSNQCRGQRMRGNISTPPIRLHGVVLSYIKRLVQFTYKELTLCVLQYYER